MVADAIKNASSRPTLLAHVIYIGDIIGISGFVNLDGDKFFVQGIAIGRMEIGLEYRVRLLGDIWSEWCCDNGYAGTRGNVQPVTGVTFRLAKQTKNSFSLCAFARFSGVDELSVIVDGQDCVSSGGEVLCGLQVGLIHYKEGLSTM